MTATLPQFFVEGSKISTKNFKTAVSANTQITSTNVDF